MKFVLTLLLLNSFAFADINADKLNIILKKAPDLWFKCEHSDSCRLVTGKCGIQIAVNKKWGKEIINFLYRDENYFDCIDFMPAQHYKKTKCFQKKCIREK